MTYSGTIENVNGMLSEIEKSGLMERPRSHVSVWFRGQARNFPLAPGVYRPSFNVASELDRLKKEQQLSQDFRLYSARLIQPTAINADRYFLQQHYGMPTRLLDWSYSPLSALYFASVEDSEDGEIYMMNANRLAITQKVDSKIFSGVGTSRNTIFKNALSVIIDWKTLGDFPNYIFPIRPDLTDTRFDLQKGCFTFHVPGKSILTTAENDSLIAFLIPKDVKVVIRKQLNLMGVNSFNIYNDLENLSKTLKQQYQIR